MENDFKPKKHDLGHEHAHIHREDEEREVDVEEARAAYYRAQYEESLKRREEL